VAAKNYAKNTMKQLQPFTTFDLSTSHFESEGHYVVPKTHSYFEALERREHAPGVLRRQAQTRGTAFAAQILWNLWDEPEEQAFVSGVIGEAAFNSAAYEHAATKEVMRRNLALPVLVDGETVQDAVSLINGAAEALSNAAQVSGRLEVSCDRYSKTAPSLRRGYGRTVGAASLMLACAPIADRLLNAGYDECQTSELARQACIELSINAKSSREKLGVYSSLAQFADSDSPLNIYFRRNAPVIARDAYNAARDTQTTI
jgi:hypothetical protein